MMRVSQFFRSLRENDALLDRMRAARWVRDPKQSEPEIINSGWALWDVDFRHGRMVRVDSSYPWTHVRWENGKYAVEKQR